MRQHVILKEMEAAGSSILGGVIRIPVTDMDRSVRFYTEALGLELLYRAGPYWATVRAGDGLKIGLLLVERAAAASEPCIQIGFEVDGPLDDAMSHLKPKGVDFPNDIYTDPTGAVRLAYFRDPDGHEHYLCEHVSA